MVKINWPVYNMTLKKRYNITLYISEEAIANWYNTKKKGKGRPNLYSDIAILTGLTLRSLFKIPLRGAEGLLNSLLKLMNIDSVKSPDYTSLCRRARNLKVPKYQSLLNKGAIELVIDSTGLKVYGEGEWKVRSHGVGKRRTWRKLHLAVDSQTGQILANELTKNNISDDAVFSALIDGIDEKEKVISCCADGAYDSKKCYKKCQTENIQLKAPPCKRARLHEKVIEYTSRNKAIRWMRDYIKKNDADEKGARKAWKEEIGYHQRSLAETAMYRFKTIVGRILRSRSFENQVIEAQIMVMILNKMTALGMPRSMEI